MRKSIFNLGENLVAALSYVLPCIAGIIILILEKENKFVRFHAMQAVLLGVVSAIINIILSIVMKIPILGILGGIASYVIGIAVLALCIYLIYMAYKGNEFKVPVIGDVAYRQIYK